MKDDFRRDAISTIALLLSAFEQVEHEAPWFKKAFEKGKSFLDKYGALSSIERPGLAGNDPAMPTEGWSDPDPVPSTERE